MEWNRSLGVMGVMVDSDKSRRTWVKCKEILQRLHLFLFLLQRSRKVRTREELKAFVLQKNFTVFNDRREK